MIEVGNLTFFYYFHSIVKINGYMEKISEATRFHISLFGIFFFTKSESLSQRFELEVM